MKNRIVAAIEYVQACLTLARSEFAVGNDDAAVDEMRKAAEHLSEAVEQMNRPRT